MFRRENETVGVAWYSFGLGEFVSSVGIPCFGHTSSGEGGRKLRKGYVCRLRGECWPLWTEDSARATVKSQLFEATSPSGRSRRRSHPGGGVSKINRCCGLLVEDSFREDLVMTWS